MHSAPAKESQECELSVLTYKNWLNLLDGFCSHFMISFVCVMGWQYVECLLSSLSLLISSLEYVQECI